MVFGSNVTPENLKQLMDDITDFVSGLDYQFEFTTIEFVNNALPSILNYQRDYALKYGQFPSVMLITISINDQGKEIETIRQTEPTRHKVLGLLDSFVWDLGIAESGFIILKK